MRLDIDAVYRSARQLWRALITCGRVFVRCPGGAASFAIVPWLRAGVAGYFLRQSMSTRKSAAIAGGSRSREAAAAEGGIAGSIHPSIMR
jgi:hypothetical protein